MSANRKFWLIFIVGLLIGMCFGGVRCTVKINQHDAAAAKPSGEVDHA